MHAPKATPWLAVLFILAILSVVRTCGSRPVQIQVSKEAARFFDAVQQGDLETARRLAASDPALIHARDRYSQTSLHLATTTGRNSFECASWLLGQGADVNAADPNGFTPLYWAAFYGKLDLVDLYLAGGAVTDAVARDGKTPLFVASDKGFTDVVAALARHGADVNRVSKEGWTPLHIAARQGRGDLVEVLLDHGANVRATDGNGQTPLQEAAAGGHTDIVERLLAQDPEMATPSRAGWTRLHQAAEDGDPALVRQLLASGARVNPVDASGRTPLFCAVESGRLEATRALLAAGADPRFVHSASGCTPLHLAAGRGDPALVALLLSCGASVQARSRAGWTPLAEAVRGDVGETGSTGIVDGAPPPGQFRAVAQILLDHGADANTSGLDGVPIQYQALQEESAEMLHLLESHGARVDPYTAAAAGRTDALASFLDRDPSLVKRTFAGGETALHSAARGGSRAAVALLLSRGADVNAIDGSGSTPLHWAARYGRMDAASELLTRGARVTGKFEQGEMRAFDMPLHRAARGGHPRMLALLLDHGADVNAHAETRNLSTPIGGIPMGGETALHFAAAGSDPECVRLLIERGADLKAKDARGATPLLFAVERGRTENAALLLAAGANPNAGSKGAHPLLVAAYYGYPGVVGVLLTNGANVGARDRVGNTALHRAVAFPDGSSPGGPLTPARREVVIQLLDHGADPNARGFLGDGPLHLACDKGYAEAVAILIDRGAAVNGRNDSGGTPLHAAAMQGDPDVVRLLLARGADVRAMSEYNTPLHLAVRFQHASVVTELLDRGADVHVPDYRGITPLEEITTAPGACTDSMIQIATMLLDRDPTLVRGRPGVSTPLHQALQRGQKKMMELLLARGADVDARDRFGMTPLHYAARDENLDFVELLVANSAEINPQDTQGHTPLYYADNHGMGARIQQLLRSHGGTGAFGEPRAVSR